MSSTRPRALRQLHPWTELAHVAEGPAHLDVATRVSVHGIVAARRPAHRRIAQDLVKRSPLFPQAPKSSQGPSRRRTSVGRVSL